MFVAPPTHRNRAPTHRPHTEKQLLGPRKGPKNHTPTHTASILYEPKFDVTSPTADLSPTLGNPGAGVGSVQGLQGLEDLDRLGPAELEAWTVYLALRVWMFNTPDLNRVFPQPGPERRLVEAWMIDYARARGDGRAPLGALIDDPDTARLLRPDEPTAAQLMRVVVHTAESYGMKHRHVLDSQTEWPNSRDLDDLEMICVAWYADQVERRRTAFQVAQTITDHTGLPPRASHNIAAAWRRLTTIAMQRTKDEARAEAELQLLSDARDPSASASARAGVTKSIAALYGLGKEDKSKSLEATIMEMLGAADDDNENERKELPHG